MCTSTVCSSTSESRSHSSSMSWRFGVAQKLIEQLELLRRERHGLSAAGRGHGAVVEHRPADGQPLLGVTARSAQQRLDAPEHLLLVDGLDHIVVRPGAEALALVGLRDAGRDHKDRQAAPALTHGARERQPVHLRHRQIHDGEVDVPVLHQRECLRPVPGREGLVARLPQHLAHQAAGAGVVLGHENVEHAASLLF